MNVYDWDKTIYDGDSSIDFYKFSVKRNPKIAKHWPRQARAALAYKRGKISKTKMKNVFYEYFQSIDNIENDVLEFWKAHSKKIKTWYLKQRRDDDLIISASPEFLLKPITDYLDVALIASKVDPKTGKNLAENCYGAEKVVRMKELYDIKDMEAFYSDSYSDDPLAQYAKESYLVVGNELKKW